MPGPSLAVLGRGEQPIDQLLVGVGRWVVDEGFHLGRLRRQAGQVEGQAADQGRPVGLVRRLEALLLQLREQEAVDRVDRPRGILDHGRARVLDGLEAPVPGPLAEVERLDLAARGRLRVYRPGGALLDPSGEGGDLVGGELRLRGHPEVVDVVDRLHEQALVGLAGDDRGAGRAAGHRVGPRIEPEAALDLRPGVARLAAVDQQRPDLRLEELDRRRVVARHGWARINDRRKPAHNSAGHKVEPASSIRLRPNRSSSRIFLSPKIPRSMKSCIMFWTATPWLSMIEVRWRASDSKTDEAGDSMIRRVLELFLILALIVGGILAWNTSRKRARSNT